MGPARRGRRRFLAPASRVFAARPPNRASPGLAAAGGCNQL